MKTNFCYKVLLFYFIYGWIGLMEFAFLFYREFYDIFIQTKNKKKKLKAEIGVVFHI